jgi:hypothetical protein
MDDEWGYSPVIGGRAAGEQTHCTKMRIVNRNTRTEASARMVFNV